MVITPAERSRFLVLGRDLESQLRSLISIVAAISFASGRGGRFVRGPEFANDT